MFKYLLLSFMFASTYVLAEDRVEPVESSYLDRLSVSTGLGIPYSILGVNLNYRLFETVEMFAGVGTWGSSYGMRVFPVASLPKFHLSVFHAANVIAISCENESCDILEDGYAGYNAAIGVSPERGESGWEFDLVFILSSGNYQDDLDEARDKGFEIEEDGGKTKLSVGYRWSF